MAASYEARAYGIDGGMSGWRARRLCPHAVVVPPRFSAYTEASRALFDLFEETAPLVEGLSLEEAFLDVRGLERISGTPRQIAERLRRRARERVGLGRHRRRRQDEGARQDGEPRRQARRPARHRARSGGGVPAAAARSRRSGESAWSPRTSSAPTGSARSASSSAGTRRSWRCSSGPMRRGTSTRSPTAATRAEFAAGRAAALDRHPVGVRRRREVRVRPRRAAGDPGRSGHAAGAGRQPRGPHRDASLSLRRLLPRHALADAAPIRRPAPARSWPRRGRCSPRPGP